MFAYGCFNHAIHDLRLDLRNLPHTARLQFWFGVPQNCDGIEQRCRVVITNRHPACNIGVEVVGSFQLSIGRQQVGSSSRTVHNSTTPELRRWERFEVEASDYTEVVLATLESCEQIRARRRVRIDDFSTRKNNLKIYDRVARPAKLWR
jgi:hypothetical protein